MFKASLDSTVGILKTHSPCKLNVFSISGFGLSIDKTKLLEDVHVPLNCYASLPCFTLSSSRMGLYTEKSGLELFVALARKAKVEQLRDLTQSCLFPSIMGLQVMVNGQARNVKFFAKISKIYVSVYILMVKSCEIEELL